MTVADEATSRAEGTEVSDAGEAGVNATGNGAKRDGETRRAAIALDPAACTSCLICVRQCPAWCISLDFHVREESSGVGRRPTKVNVLDQFTIDFGLCMYCGICVEVCPFDALRWSSFEDYAAPIRSYLARGADALAAWWPSGS